MVAATLRGIGRYAPPIQPGWSAWGLGWIKKEHAQGRAHAAEGCGAESPEAFYRLKNIINL